MDGSIVLLNDPETDSLMYMIPKQNIRDLWCIDDDNIVSNLNNLKWQKVYDKAAVTFFVLIHKIQMQLQICLFRAIL